MSTTNTTITLASRLKEMYPKGITNLFPSSAELTKRIVFRKDIQTGEKARFDVQLSPENGVTCGSGSFALLDPIAQVAAKSEVVGSQVIIRSWVSYDLISRAANNKVAFASFLDSKFIPVVESFRNRCEIYNLVGRQGVGVVSANNAGTFTITPASWNSALWMNLIGCTLEAWTAVAGSGSQHDGDVVVSSISTTNHTVSVTGTNSSIVAGDILFLKTQRSYAPYGLMDIAKNTGTLFSIDAATNPAWAASAYDCGTSAVTLGKLAQAACLAADKGCSSEAKLVCMLSPKAFQSVASDQAALREYGVNYSKSVGENGFEKLKFWTPAGPLEIISYLYMPEGAFVIYPERFTYRIGSEEGTSELSNTGEMFFDVSGSNSKEMRMYADYTVYSEKPCFFVIGTRSDSLALHT